MAEIVLGIGTSHTPLLSLQPELWLTYAEGDHRNPELAFPRHGWVMPFDEGVEYVSPETRARFKGAEPFPAQAAAFQRALNTLASTLQAARPDVTIIISDDQDEWFYEHNMPRFAIYWGESVPMRPRTPVPASNPEIYKAVVAGYGDIPLEVPVAHEFGRYLIEYLSEHEFDVAHFNHLAKSYGGQVQRRYPSRDGETDYVRTTPEHEQGLPHGFAFIVKRLFDNQPGPILPVFQNTCYPPNQPTPNALLPAWPGHCRGGQGLAEQRSSGRRCLGRPEPFRGRRGVRSLPAPGAREEGRRNADVAARERLFSATSESLNWVALGGAMHDSDLRMELLDYVPVYRTPASTGGGWAFARWQ